MALIRSSLRHRSLGQTYVRGTIDRKFRLWPTAPHFEGKFSRDGLRALQLGRDQRPRSGSLPPQTTTKTGTKEGKHGVFLDDLPRFLQKSGDFFAAPPNNRQKKRFTVLQ